jgi:hypothetical protein
MVVVSVQMLHPLGYYQRRAALYAVLLLWLRT